MEPMTLGSPGSPATPNMSTPYLPGFLMGDHMPNSPGQPRSPTKAQRQVHFSPNLPSTSTMGTDNTPLLEFRNRSQNILQGTPVEKAGGPPTVGLFDMLKPKTVVPTPSNTQRSNVLSTSLQSPYPVNENECWVTVFGYPPSSSPLVLGHFSQAGNIVEHVYPEKGNWVNLRYSCKTEARKALSYNGRIIGGTIMIGVIQCHDQNILRDVTNVGTPISASKSPRSLSRRLVSPTSPYVPSSPVLKPRSLASSTVDLDVVGSQAAPAKNTSIVSKTMDFFFGWEM